MSNLPNNPEKASISADQPHTPTTNEDILELLRQLVEQDTTTNGQVAPNQNSQQSETTKDASPEDVKRLLEELLKAKAAPADIEVNDEEDATDDDNEFEGEFFWNPAPEWEPVAYAAGGAALVGLGALLYHLLKD